MRLILFCLSMLAPTAASALSCMATDTVWLYQHIKEDEADYLLVKGRLTLTEPANIPEPRFSNSVEALTEARATGFALSKSGFDVPFDRPVILRATCLASWCGSPAYLTDETYIFALKADGDQLLLTLSACGGFVHRWSEEEEKRLIGCHLIGACPEPEF